LYDLLPNVARANTDPPKPSSSSHADGVIGSVKTQSTFQSTTLSSTSPKTQISEVNAVQSTPSQQFRGKKKTKNPVVLTQPFPQQQSMVAHTPSLGVSSIHPNDEASSSAHIYMFNGINLTTRSKTYDTPGNPDKGKDTNGTGTLPDPSPSSVIPPSVNPPFGPLQIEKPAFDSILRPPKSTIRKATFNPSSRAAQMYNIVEDLAQAPCAMSALEVLQHCPSQCKTLLATIGAIDPKSSNHIMFNLDNYMSRLSHQLAFQVDVVVHNQQIHRTILDEGASTCVMSLACWKGLKSPILYKSPTMLRTFDG
jgi:hypothetical protein